MSRHLRVCSFFFRSKSILFTPLLSDAERHLQMGVIQPTPTHSFQLPVAKEFQHEENAR